MFSYKKIILLPLFLLFLFQSYSYADSDLITFLRSINSVSFCGKQIPINRPDVRERLEKEILLALWDKAQVVLWLKRSARYFPIIESVLKEQSLNNDLKYVSVIESALRPGVKSHKNAAGFWQFIPSTGEMYGLRIDRFVDERRDIKLSSIAAGKYLTQLYEKFNNWELALASYNIGEMRIIKELEAQKVDSYYDLWLPQETMRYFFKVIAAKLIFENKEKLGFKLIEEDYYQLNKTTQVKIKLKYTIPIYLAAKSIGISYYSFKRLNPAVVGDFFKKGTTTINIPIDRDEKRFKNNFSNTSAKWVKENRLFYYRVKKGDNLIKIANKFEVSIKNIMEWNSLGYKDYIFPGQKLVIRSNKSI